MSNLRKFTLQAMDGWPLAYSLVSGEIVESGYASIERELTMGIYERDATHLDVKKFITEYLSDFGEELNQDDRYLFVRVWPNEIMVANVVMYDMMATALSHGGKDIYGLKERRWIR